MHPCYVRCRRALIRSGLFLARTRLHVYVVSVWRCPLSREAIALRKSNSVFKKGVDPDNLITVLYSNLLLTPEKKSKATQWTLTDEQKLWEVFTAMERRVSVTSDDFHKLADALRDEPALKPVGDKIRGQNACSLEVAL